jgi:Leucine-rich repeat (LRR) protein
MPAEVGNLKHLRKLNLAEMNLKGEMPWPQICGLTKLVELKLCGNEVRRRRQIPRYRSKRDQLVAAAVPTEIRKLQLLEKLDLRWMNLAGVMPWGSVCTLTKLEALDLSYNDQLEGSEIPQHIDQLTGLKTLNLAEANLTGTLPWDSLCALTSLERLNLRTNEGLDLSEIPEVIGQLQELRQLDVCKMKLSGK